MRNATWIVVLAAAVAASASGLFAAEGWKPLMDGKTLAGWHAVGDGTWAVEDGAFVGRANNEKLYGLLVSDKPLGDATVRFKFQSNTGDSGFYIRTVIKPPEQAHGLQIQVGPAGSGCGGVYESYGRAWLVKPDVALEKKLLKTDGWNEMVVSAHGGDVTVELNGVKTAELKNDPSRKEGHLALQMHAGCKMEVRFKDIEMKE